jgi:hypothetical protein
MLNRCTFLVFVLTIWAFNYPTERTQAQNSQVAQNTVSNYAAGQLRSIQGRNSAELYTISKTNQQVLNRGIPPVGVAGINRQSFNAGRASSMIGNSSIAGSGSKPFSRLDRGPAVSPYLALSNPFSTPSDYYNIVRPQQEQSRVNQQVAKQQYTQSRRLNQLAARGPYEITGGEGYAPTGHASGFMRFGTYMNTGGYFAPPTRPKSER